ncbi:MAG: hypothetical protein ACXWZ2_09165, partial [Mycobacterium sp.]
GAPSGPNSPISVLATPDLPAYQGISDNMGWFADRLGLWPGPHISGRSRSEKKILPGHRMSGVSQRLG